MAKLTEFYLEKQGRPDSKVALDMETRQPSIPSGYIAGVMLKASYTETSKAEDYTAANETVILVDASGNAVTITLPAASTNAGKYYYIKKVDSSGRGVTVKGNTITETIDGEVSVSMAIQYQHIMVLCDGTVWWILGGVNVKMEEILKAQETLLEQLTKQLRVILSCLSSMSGLNIKEEDI